MTVLVTGANGFLGSAVVQSLVADGAAAIRCLVRPGSDASSIERLPGVTIVRGDLLRRADCERIVQGTTTIYHLAAGLGGAPADLAMNSVVATRNLLDAIVGTPRPAKLVHCSSFGVIGVADLPRQSKVDESTPMDPHPEQRDPYAFTKHRQEALVWEYQRAHQLSVVVLRPGVIYGPGGGGMSNRVGLRLFGILLHMGRRNVLPLTYVTNCADAFVVAGNAEAAIGQIYNVVDDDLPTAKQFLKRYRKEVERVPYVSLPWIATRVMTAAIERYVDYSKGQLPAILTRYKVASLWKGNRFSNDKLKSIGWRPSVSTDEGIRRHFAALREIH